MVRRNKSILYLIFFLTAACGGSVPYSGGFSGGGGFADGGPPGTGNAGTGEGVIAVADAGSRPDAGACAGDGSETDSGTNATADAGDVADSDGGTDADAGADDAGESDAGAENDSDAGADVDAGIDDDDDDAGAKRDGGKKIKDRRDCPEASKHGRGRGKGCGGALRRVGE